MQVIILIKELVEDIEFMDICFKKMFQVKDVLRAVRKKKIPKEGQLGHTRYYFHGIGCRVVFPDGRIINFDYSPMHICGGFSLHDLLDYMASKGLKISEEEVSQELKKLESTGNIFFPKLPPNTDLFYLKKYKVLLKNLLSK